MDSLQEKLARQPLTMPTALAAGQTGADQPDASGAKAPVRNKRAENASPQGIQEGTLKEAPAKPAASDTEAWQELMNRFKKAEVYIWSMLTQGNLVAGQNGEFCWQAAQDAGEKIYVENLNQPEKQQKISQTLSEITGRTCTFRASERNRKQTAAAAANDDEAYLQTLYETFGAAPVSVVD